MAIELDDNRWMLGFSTGLGQRPRQRNIATRDTGALEREIRSAKRRFHLPEDARVLSCYEAGREGFWLHRYLIDSGVGNVVVDAGSLEARKKRRRVTPALAGGAREADRVDLEKLLRMLIRFHAGDQDVWSVVRVPGARLLVGKPLLEGLTRDRPIVFQRARGRNHYWNTTRRQALSDTTSWAAGTKGISLSIVFDPMHNLLRCLGKVLIVGLKRP
jgi:hypothetical protein